MKFSRLSLIALILQLSGTCLAATPASGLDATSFDPAVRVQDDLFLAANGKWLRDTPIPAAKSLVIGVEVLDITDARIRAIVDGLASKPGAGRGVEKQVGAFYAAFLDTGAIDKAGVAPLKPLLKEIDAIRSVGQLARGRANPLYRSTDPANGTFRMKAIVVEDSRLAREGLVRMLAAFPEVDVLGQADHPDSALTLIQATRPDVIFLEIHMPGASGFDLLAALDYLPQIASTTAYSEYAIRSFVNLQEIRAIEESISFGYDVTMNDGKVIEISRRNAAELKELLSL